MFGVVSDHHELSRHENLGECEASSFHQSCCPELIVNPFRTLYVLILLKPAQQINVVLAHV